MTFDSDRQYDEMGENYPFIDKNKEGYTPEEAIKVLTKAQMYEYVKKTVKRYGLERTEEIIKEVYKTVPGLQEQILAMLYEVWKGL